jgi:DNA-binding transcriptional ArsR family regulator
MTDPDIPEALREFIRDYIPDVDAAELLLLLARNPERRYSVRTVIEEIRKTGISESIVHRHLETFRERGLVVQLREDDYQYFPVLPQLDPMVRALSKAYQERPVTMMRMIYALKDEKSGPLQTPPD